jgi:hypothetical protein
LFCELVRPLLLGDLVHPRDGVLLGPCPCACCG